MSRLTSPSFALSLPLLLVFAACTDGSGDDDLDATPGIGGAPLGSGGVLAGGAGGAAPSGGATSGGTNAVGGSAGGGASSGGALPEGSGGVASGGSDPGGVGGDAGPTGGAGSGGAPSDCVPDGKAHNTLVTHIFTADPNAVVYEDGIYLYTSHDVDGQDGFDMVDYRGFFSDDMVNWQDLGVLIHADSLPWAGNLYAPGACAKNDKYYLYMPNSGSGIGVAVSDSPKGPFVDPLGVALLTKSFPNANVPWLFDPACFVDDDGQGYLYFGGGDDGGQNARVVRLGDDMISLKDAQATTIPTTAFFEASFMHKRDDKYYFSYSADFSSGHGAALEYLMSDSPMSGFEYQGAFLPNANINNGNNNHGSIVEFMDKTYLFYHNRKLQQELGVDKVNNRSVAVQELTYATDGSINSQDMSTADFTVEQIKCLDGFSEVEAERLAMESGIEVEGKAGETVRVAQIDNGDWVAYSQVDFRGGATQLVVQVASASGGGTIDVVIDGCIDGSEGTSIGTCEVVGTEGGVFAALSCPLTETSGGHDLCLKFTGDPSFELDSFHLE